jgi:hypothetical protein
MILIDECSQYTHNEIVKEKPKDIFWVPVNKGSIGGIYLKICRKNDYWRVVDFDYNSKNPTCYDMKEINNADVSEIINDPVNFLLANDPDGTIKLSGGKMLKAFIPNDADIYVKTGYFNEAKVRIQTVEPGLYYATIYNVRGNFINYEGFLADERGRNADEAIKDPQNYRMAWDYIVLDGGYRLVKKVLAPEELEQLKHEGKISTSGKAGGLR